MEKATWKRVGTCGVDSGLMMLADPCYVLSDEDYERMLGEINGLKYPVRYSRKRPESVIVSAGFGDGGYSVYAKVGPTSWGTRIKELKIVFIPEGME